MAFSKVLVGWMAACALSAAQAGTLSNANTGTGAGASGSLAHAERFDYGDSNLPQVAADLNEQILRIPADASGTVTLEATLFKPNGPGPFPLVVFNHGKNTGDLHLQPRSRPLAFAREFVRRGYAVIAPNRQGFAGSDGTYQQEGCNVGKNGLAQAADVDATVRYMSRQPYVDASRIVVAGTSHGGLVSVAYGTEAAPGVRGIINFSGGLRQDLCDGWQRNLVDAFDQYGAHTAVRSLWLYGDNDSVWTPGLVAQMHDAYVSHGTQAQFIDFGRYKDDAHRLIVDRDGVPVWWPAVNAFLAQLNLPTSVRYAVANPHEPKATGYASIDAVNAVPYVDEAGREGYRRFLNQHPSRAFAVSSEGAWSWAEGGDDPMALALDNCAKQGAGACRLYAVNDRVVWNTTTQTADNGDDHTRDTDTRALASR
ncbi:TPA: prolyl oligopeptidase family serine peptidase [Burkholderia cepacia ATCC 25416]|uniref:dienelactone hydrolase family protein n=1 Tax=Burkholderia cepacia TaxID=292 RepID=UPI001CF4FC62|nr:CocE/NonD family hydrolase [Burkholderia cepacia]HDR9771699.1 prolyl oligopeptidase family serine peptidase [Burkholderia cepacia ATCC 25416]MCA8078263.1 prolyl oligopeptidase family serine peptidase [Burkholderia cepacia]HDR9780034.1 prolyl oligopeptidase family serine peptidase [Burkholderia cepacia ATCC 25416]HDR9787484.1 prolyl oligopeptidase family serine peptidase [Burkholderia cepacia ATCC 25416]HDR9794111.1 prolyl oligopeptidase family serine peptidase [Burkholderia cepacia ATCC 254